MERTIKFRAWNKKRKEMIHLRPMESTISIGNHICFGCEEYGHEYREDDCIDEDFELMQFTGLTDCNNREIYEGDIVRLENYANDKVVFDAGRFCVYKSGMGLYKTHNTGIEVIGNIHENKNLI